jgi:hypothetical protein
MRTIMKGKLAERKTVHIIHSANVLEIVKNISY